MTTTQNKEEYRPDGLALLALRGQEKLTDAERAEALRAGTDFAAVTAGQAPHPCLVISGQFMPPGIDTPTADELVKQLCMEAFGYQTEPPGSGQRTIDVLLDSTGGSLDIAFKILRYLTWFASEVNVYVPRRAKSASTLIALGARHIYLSPFGELGPLDTQIPDPRNPTSPNYVSALDCYQSVDYVREFGLHTMSKALRQLSDDARGQTALVDLLETASAFGIGAITPMLKGVRAQDFGAWGRSLKIGERYAELILQDGRPTEDAGAIASRLVYDYTHHYFPIDFREAKAIGFDCQIMSSAAFAAAMEVIRICDGRPFIAFVSANQTQVVEESEGVQAKGEAIRPTISAAPRVVTPAAETVTGRAPRAATAADLADRKGYDPQFLATVVEHPTLSAALNAALAPVADREDGLLNYANFSIRMHRDRRLAIYTAVNIDGARARNIPRGHDRWGFDPRLESRFQVGDTLYEGNKLDRGHLVRRLDPAWGDEFADAQRASEDTFFYTNCTPQHEILNQKLWLGLEDYILGNADVQDLRASVFTGPVFRDDDRRYRDFLVPEDFWKVAVMVDAQTGAPSATAYLVSQRDFMNDLEFTFGGYLTYQVPITQVEQLTGLDFGDLKLHDPLRDQETPSGLRLSGFDDIRLSAVRL